MTFFWGEEGKRLSQKGHTKSQNITMGRLTRQHLIGPVTDIRYLVYVSMKFIFIDQPFTVTANKKALTSIKSLFRKFYLRGWANFVSYT